MYDDREGSDAVMHFNQKSSRNSNHYYDHETEHPKPCTAPLVIGITGMVVLLILTVLIVVF